MRYVSVEATSAQVVHFCSGFNGFAAAAERSNDVLSGLFSYFGEMPLLAAMNKMFPKIITVIDCTHTNVFANMHTNTRGQRRKLIRRK